MIDFKPFVAFYDCIWRSYHFWWEYGIDFHLKCEHIIRRDEIFLHTVLIYLLLRLWMLFVEQIPGGRFTEGDRHTGYHASTDDSAL